MKPKKRTLKPKDFAGAFGEELSPYVRRRISEYAFEYQDCTMAERDAWFHRIMWILLQSEEPPAGPGRHPHWNSGWTENLERFRRKPNLEALIPAYFGKYGVIRWMRDFIRPLSPQFEYRSLALIQDWLFDQFLRRAKAIYEFGCGTGHNLVRARAVNPQADLYGLDWAESSQELLDLVRLSNLGERVTGRRFDLFQPDPDLRLEPEACVFTVAALEQVGRSFEPFLDFLIKQPIQCCIHIEPIAELLDPSHLLDFLSLEYFKMRHYLDGYLDRLRELEQQGRIRILCCRRTHIGSLFIDGYSVVVWEPVRH